MNDIYKIRIFFVEIGKFMLSSQTVESEKENGGIKFEMPTNAEDLIKLLPTLEKYPGLETVVY